MAKWSRPQFLKLEIEGSNPSDATNHSIGSLSSARLEHQLVTLGARGSSPLGTAKPSLGVVV